MLTVECTDRKARIEVQVAGGKNAVLPLVFASLLMEGTTELRRVPTTIRDLRIALDIVKALGLRVEEENADTIKLQVPPTLNRTDVVPGRLASSIRYSALLLGAMVSRTGEATIPIPGGCAIGPSRPLDIHISGMQAAGVKVVQSGQFISARKIKTKKNVRFQLRFPSVGATENLLILLCTMPGEHVLNGCAREPEVQDLARFLNACGARIRGIGKSTVHIAGVKALKPVMWEVLPDRIEAGSYAILAACTGSEAVIYPVVPDHMRSITEALGNMGIEITMKEAGGSMNVRAAKSVRHLNLVAAPYPHFPTDLMPIIGALCLRAADKSILQDRVYPHRFSYAEDFAKFGGLVHRTNNGLLVYDSTDRLRGIEVEAHDIRAGFACICVAAQARGTTHILNELQIERGYDSLYQKLDSFGLVTKKALRS